MKTLSFILLATFSYASVFSQSLTIRFEGINNPNNTVVRNYVVDLDGRKYYSANADVAGTSGAKQLVINDLQLGSHRLAVYETNDNSTVS